METTKQQLTINIENINKSIESIKSYSFKKDFVITGEFSVDTFTNEFPSTRAKKRFRHSLNGVINHPTMKSSNLFLHYLSKYSNSTLKLEYSAKEKQIIELRKKWKEARAIADSLMNEYKEVKGDYYLTFKQK